MSANAEIAVTLSSELWHHLVQEATRLRVPFEWLVAGIVADTIEGFGPPPRAAA
jgi:hypothetical protein